MLTIPPVSDDCSQPSLGTRVRPVLLAVVYKAKQSLPISYPASDLPSKPKTHSLSQILVGCPKLCLLLRVFLFQLCDLSELRLQSGFLSGDLFLVLMQRRIRQEAVSPV